MKIGCVLLAAGAGKRFGGGKLLHEIDGEAMITRALRLYGKISFAARICVTRSEACEIHRSARDFGSTCRRDSISERSVSASAANAGCASRWS